MLQAMTIIHSLSTGCFYLESLTSCKKAVAKKLLINHQSISTDPGQDARLSQSQFQRPQGLCRPRPQEGRAEVASRRVTLPHVLLHNGAARAVGTQ